MYIHMYNIYTVVCNMLINGTRKLELVETLSHVDSLHICIPMLFI